MEEIKIKKIDQLVKEVRNTSNYRKPRGKEIMGQNKFLPIKK